MFKMNGDTTRENPLTREKCYSQISMMHLFSKTKKMKFQTTSDDQTNTVKTFAKEEGSIIK